MMRPTPPKTNIDCPTTVTDRQHADFNNGSAPLGGCSGSHNLGVPNDILRIDAEAKLGVAATAKSLQISRGESAYKLCFSRCFHY